MNKIEGIVREIKGDNSFKLPLDTIDYDAWASWYKGDVADFHNYNIYNGKQNVPVRLKSMQMAKKVCEDWADLLLNEKCDIVLPNEEANEEFHKLLKRTNFWVKGNEAIEKSFALGLGVLVLGVDDLEVGDKGTIKIKDTTKLRVDFVDRFKLKPIKVENKEITEIAFVFYDSDVTTYIIHLKDENKDYKIYTRKYNKENTLIESFEFNTKSKTAWFQVIRPFISNNDIMSGYDTALGTSVFANSIDVLKSIDTKYDSFNNEFVAGRKRLFVTEEVIRVHNKKDGGQISSFNPMDSTIHLLNQGDQQDNPYVKDESGALRASEHVLALNTELAILSSKCGLGEVYYKFDGSGTATATQVISENSNLYRTLKKHQILIESVLNNLSIAIIEASNNFTNSKIKETSLDDINIIFDDSIIEDTETLMTKDKMLVNDKIMSPIEFRVKWLGESEETATENYRKYFKYDIINKYLPALQSGAMTVKQFVLEVEGKEDADMEAYITENLDRGGSYVDDILKGYDVEGE